ncbi:hypothetical protein D3C86_1398820 [compost metagenome]
MHTKWYIIPLFNTVYREDMVDMCMGIDDLLRHQLLFCYKLKHLLLFFHPIHTRINDPALALIVVQDIGIFLEGIAGKLFYV